MTIAKKSILAFLVIVLIVLGLDLAVQFFIDLGPVKTRITSRACNADCRLTLQIDRIGLDVLPRPQLELHDLRLVFADGTVLRVPLVGLSPSLTGLFAGRPEIVSIQS